MRRLMLCLTTLLLLCSCSLSDEPKEIVFPSDYPQISFESYPLGAPAEQAAEELGCSEDVLRLLSQFGSTTAGISPEAFQERGGFLYLKAVHMDHMQILFRGDSLFSVSWFFYIRQFDTPELFFTAVAEWHSVLSEVLTANGYSEESLKLSELCSAADFEENTRQTTLWTNGVYELQLTLMGSGDSVCCYATVRIASSTSD